MRGIPVSKLSVHVATELQILSDSQAVQISRGHALHSIYTPRDEVHFVPSSRQYHVLLERITLASKL